MMCTEMEKPFSPPPFFFEVGQKKQGFSWCLFQEELTIFLLFLQSSGNTQKAEGLQQTKKPLEESQIQMSSI